MIIMHLLFTGYILLVIAWIWLYTTRPYIARKYIIRNNIQAQVESRTHFTDIDKVNLLAELINDIDFDKVPPYLSTALKNKINTLAS